LLQLLFHNANYNELKKVLQASQANPLTYLTERNLPFRFGKYKSEQDALKQAKLLFSSDFDLGKTDAEKKQMGLNIFTDEQLIATDPNLAILSQDYAGRRTHEAMAAALKHCDMAVWEHDFCSMQ